MGVTVNTSNNRVDNSNRLSSVNGNNSLTFGGSNGQGNKQKTNSQNEGNL